MSVIERMRAIQNAQKQEAALHQYMAEKQSSVAQEQQQEAIRLDRARKLVNAMKRIHVSGAYKMLSDLKKHLHGDRLIAFPDGISTDFDPKDERMATVVLKWGKERRVGFVREFDPDIPTKAKRSVRWSVWREIAVTSRIDSSDIDVWCGVKTDKPEGVDAHDESTRFFHTSFTYDEWRSKDFLEDKMARELHRAGIKV